MVIWVLRVKWRLYNWAYFLCNVFINFYMYSAFILVDYFVGTLSFNFWLLYILQYYCSYTDHWLFFLVPTLVQQVRQGTTSLGTIAVTPTTTVRLATPRMRQKSPITLGQGTVKIIGSQPGSTPQIISVAAPKSTPVQVSTVSVLFRDVIDRIFAQECAHFWLQCSFSYTSQ